MSKVVLFTPTPTHPANAGNRARVYALAEAMERVGVELNLVFIRMEKGDESSMAKRWGKHLCYFLDAPVKPIRRPVWLRAINKACRLFGCREPDVPHRVDDWCGDELLFRCSTLMAEIRPDVVWVEYVFLSRILTAAPAGALKVLDSHDVFANRHKMMRAQGKEPEWFFTTPREEAKGCLRADIVVAIQDREREYFERVYRAKAQTIGHFVALQSFGPQQTVEPVIIFIGSSNGVNVDAIQSFLREVWPNILAKVPAVRLEIYGDCGKCLPTYLPHGVTVVGQVADLDEAYARAWVVVSPLRMGTGLKIKTIEALGRGKAVVASASGSEGMEDGAGKAYLLATNPEMFTFQCVKLLQDASYRKKLESSALAYAGQWNQTNRSVLESLIKIGNR